MPARRKILLAALALLIAFLGWKLARSHFDWRGFWAACKSANPRFLLIGVALIYANYFVRAARWAVFLRPQTGGRVPWTSLVASQFIGFAGLAAFGRIGELIRPYLVARRTGLPFPSQVAVVAVERIFDMGAFAVLFSLDLALAPGLRALPYHDRFHLIGYAAVGAIVVLGGMAVALRKAGATVAAAAARPFVRLSPALSRGITQKLLAFRDGLNAIGSLSDFFAVSALSLILWASIAASYVAVMHALPAPVQNIGPAGCILLMGFSVAGSFAQLPGVGGGSQASVLFALTHLFGVSAELAASAAILLWLVNTMSVIPAGIVLARQEEHSLLQVARASRTAATPVAR